MNPKIPTIIKVAALIVAVIMLTSAAHSCYGQLNSVFKSAESLNADSTTVRNMLRADSVAAREAGYMYFNNQSNKWRLGWWSTGQPIRWQNIGSGTGAGNLSGTLTATRIPYATAAHVLSDVANLNWDTASDRILVSNDAGTLQSSVFGGQVSGDEPGQSDFFSLTVNSGGAQPSLTLSDGTDLILMSPGFISSGPSTFTIGGQNQLTLQSTNGDVTVSSLSGNVNLLANDDLTSSSVNTSMTATVNADFNANNIATIAGINGVEIVSAAGNIINRATDSVAIVLQVPHPTGSLYVFKQDGLTSYSDPFVIHGYNGSNTPGGALAKGLAIRGGTAADGGAGVVITGGEALNNGVGGGVDIGGGDSPDDGGSVNISAGNGGANDGAVNLIGTVIVNGGFSVTTTGNVGMTLGGTLSITTVGSAQLNGANIFKGIISNQTLDFGSTLTLGETLLVPVVTGASTGDGCSVSAPASIGVFTCRVSSANNVTVVFHNTTGSTQDPASGVYRIMLFR